jgi:EAL domain-containing protein (putative c-di-GMP-specific phosphodiesterase class I)
VSVTVNLSARQVADPELAAEVQAALDASGLAPDRLCLEITETTLMEDADSPLQTLDALRASGVRLALDDFGTGYSSLAYLRRFPLDVLKIDRSFIAGIEHDHEAAALVGAVMTMAGSLGLDVVAEGIETEAQRARLRELGCRLGQGYLFARALPGEELRRALAGAALPA